MARPLRIEFPHAFYHVLSRGNEKRVIFKKDHDYQIFLDLLEECGERFRGVVHSYCLMSNHFHLLVETFEPNLSQWMKRLLGVYTMRFNRKYKRVGHLFQGRYKALVVDKDSYLLELSRYIHLNPCRAGQAALPEHYPWSSMKYFLGQKGPPFLERETILSCFLNQRDYRNFVLEGMGISWEPLQRAVGGVFLGPQSFVDQFQEKIRKKENLEISRKAEIVRIPLDRLDHLIENGPNEFKIYCYWKWGNLTQRQIGEKFLKAHSTVSYIIKKFEEKLRNNPSLRQQVAKLAEQISKIQGLTPRAGLTDSVGIG